MAYLFDTNAISETFRKRPNRDFTAWLAHLPRVDQFVSTVAVGELYAAAFRAPNATRWRRRIDGVVLPTMTVLLFDLDCARETGRLQADLASRGLPIDTADVQIAATAIVHGLIVVTANERHFARIRGLPLETFTPGDA